MKNKKLTAIVALVVGATTLATAAFANSGNANGYTVYKNALKTLLKQENYTSSASARFLFDNELYASEKMTWLYDKNGEVILNKISESTYDDRTYRSEEYVQDNLIIYSSGDRLEDSSKKGYSVHSAEYRDKESFSPIYLGFEPETQDKVVNFAETAADTFIGDLKNNFIMTSSDDNCSTYSINLESFQVPAIVTSGMDMMSAMLKESIDDADLTDGSRDAMMMSLVSNNPQIKNASCTFTVDNEGRLTHNLLSGTLEGGGHTLTLEIELKACDYGTTRPERLDLDSAPNVHYQEKGLSTKNTTSDKKVTIDKEAVDAALLDAAENNLTVTLGGTEYSAEEAEKVISEAIDNQLSIEINGKQFPYSVTNAE